MLGDGTGHFTYGTTIFYAYPGGVGAGDLTAMVCPMSSPATPSAPVSSTSRRTRRPMRGQPSRRSMFRARQFRRRGLVHGHAHGPRFQRRDRDQLHRYGPRHQFRWTGAASGRCRLHPRRSGRQDHHRDSLHGGKPVDRHCRWEPRINERGCDACGGGHVRVRCARYVQVGSAFDVTITARDPFGNIATTYSGTVHFTSTDPDAQLPADTTLTNGVGTISVTFMTEGEWTITASDDVTDLFTESDPIIATPPPPAPSIAPTLAHMASSAGRKPMAGW